MYNKVKICALCDNCIVSTMKSTYDMEPTYCIEHRYKCDIDFSCNSFVNRKAMNAKRGTLIMHTRHVRT